MENYTDLVTHILSLLIVVSNVLTLIILFSVFCKWKKIKIKFFEDFLNYFKDNALFLGLLTAATGVLGSLFYSELANFAPCKLCWFQRIFIYPQLILLSVASYKKDSKIWDYVLSIAFIGFLIALYHYVIQMNQTLGALADQVVPCSIVGMTPSCTSYFFLKFGYITIPMMSLTLSLNLLVLGFLQKLKK